LDLNAVIWLEDYLSKWKNTLLIVSHDQVCAWWWWMCGHVARFIIVLLLLFYRGPPELSLSG